MIAISDFSISEEWIIHTTLKERYGQGIELQHADADIRLNASDRELTRCPVIMWLADYCNFVVFETGDRRYRCQFFYKPFKQFGTGVREYNDLSECTVALLQARADQVAEERGDFEVKRR